jgi:MoxR-like ATPase
MFAYLTELAALTRVQSVIRIGVSPRGTIALLRNEQGFGLSFGAYYLIPQDVHPCSKSTARTAFAQPAPRLVSGVSEQELVNRALPQVQWRRYGVSP